MACYRDSFTFLQQDQLAVWGKEERSGGLESECIHLLCSLKLSSQEILWDDYSDKKFWEELIAYFP
jgi:hypothetical protein